MRRETMRNKLATAALLALVATPTVIAQPAFAQDPGYQDSDHRDHDGDRTYRGDGGDYRRKCGGGNGAVGTVAGGVGGAVVGNAVGGGVLGTVAGGVGGALLGRHLDKKHTEHKNDC
jgi:hypothetical protein